MFYMLYCVEIFQSNICNLWMKWIRNVSQPQLAFKPTSVTHSLKSPNDRCWMAPPSLRYMWYVPHSHRIFLLLDMSRYTAKATNKGMLLATPTPTPHLVHRQESVGHGVKDDSAEHRVQRRGTTPDTSRVTVTSCMAACWLCHRLSRKVYWKVHLLYWINRR